MRAPVAQLDRVTDSDSVGHAFESHRAYHSKTPETVMVSGVFAVMKNGFPAPFEMKLIYIKDNNTAENFIFK